MLRRVSWRHGCAVRLALVLTACVRRVQVEEALATILGASRNEFAAEVPIKRLLLLLEMARQGLAGGDEPQVAVTEITLERWTEVIRDLAY